MIVIKTHRQARQNSLRPAFTLTELLVTASIILILAILAFWGTSRFIASAKQAKCLSNLRQIGVAVMSYSGDNGGNLPYLVTGDVDKPTSHASIWQEDLDSFLPYPKPNPSGGGKPLADSTFHCPSANPKKKWSGTQPDYAAVRRVSASAGASGVFSQNAWGVHVAPLKASNIRNPERCLMVADACAATGVKDGAWNMSLNMNNLKVSAGVPASGLAPRHGYDGKDSRSGSVSMLFCDGHVEVFRYSDPRLNDPTFLKSLLVPF